MTPLHAQPIERPAAWSASDFDSIDELSFDLGTRHLRAFDDALAVVKERGLGVDDISRGDFPLDAIEDDIESLADQVQNGRGIVIVRGFPIERANTGRGSCGQRSHGRRSWAGSPCHGGLFLATSWE